MRGGAALCSLLLSLWVTLTATPAGAAPVSLEEADVQAFLQDDGAMDVIYSLTFRDNEGRTQIRKAGPFYEPIHFTRAFLREGDQSYAARVSPVGGGYYAVDFSDHPTRAGGRYTVELHYRTDHRFAEPTTRDGQPLLAVWFNPIRWTFPIGRSVIKLVLPLSLDPDRVKRHEDITPAMVDALGVITDPEVLAAQSHWAFVYSDYRETRRLTLYAEKRDLPAEAVHLVRVYLPTDAAPSLAVAAGLAPPRPKVAEGEAFLVDEDYAFTLQKDGTVQGRCRPWRWRPASAFSRTARCGGWTARLRPWPAGPGSTARA